MGRIASWLARIRHQVQLSARGGFEFGGALLPGKVVADAQRVAVQFIDRGEGLAVIGALGAGDRHALWAGRGVDRVSPAVRRIADEDLIFPAVELEADDVDDGLIHWLSPKF